MGLGAAAIPASLRARDRTPLETASAALASAPGVMPCREAERADIARFVEEAVAAGVLLGGFSSVLESLRSRILCTLQLEEACANMESVSRCERHVSACQQDASIEQC